MRLGLQTLRGEVGLGAHGSFVEFLSLFPCPAHTCFYQLNRKIIVL